jgi:uncharacterized protein (TIGR02265 family)
MVETGSQQELEQRLALVGPKDTAIGFFFNAALQVVRNEGDAAALARCHEAVDGRFMAFFSYPVGTLNQLLYAAARSLSEKHGGFDAAMRQLGHQMVPGYLESAAGRALLMLAGGEPRRTLHSLPPAYRAAMRHGDCLARGLTSSSGLLVFADCTLPTEYLEGAVRAVFDTLRVGTVKVAGRREGVSKTEIEVSW